MKLNKALFGFIRIAFSIMIILLVLIAAMKLSGKGYDFGYRVFTEPAMEEEPGRDVLVQVSEGMSNKELGEMLKQKGLIKDADLFYFQIKLSAYSKRIVPGIYTLNTSMDAKQMMVIMSTPPGTETTETKNQIKEKSK